MSQPFLGTIQAFSFGFTPKGWASCNGQLLPINQYQALFSLLGTQFGGNGISNFALPNLQGRVPISMSPNYSMGQTGGEVAHTLTANEMPPHTHPMTGSTLAGQNTPANGYPGASPQNFYAPAGNTTLGTGSSPNTGGQPHPNQPPFMTLNYCIALQGIFPSRN